MKFTFKKSLICLLIILTSSIYLCGCYTYQKIEVMDIEEELSSDIMVNVASIYEEGQTAATQIIDVGNEPFQLYCKYDTKDYPLDKWRITANKNIHINVNTINLPEGYEVHLEHLHADIILKSTSPDVDGITQDSFDDYDHRMPSKGFPINDNIAYNTIFAIEGYTEQFYTMWGNIIGGLSYTLGYIDSSYERLSEGNLRKLGTYAEKLIIVYDLVVSTPDFPEGYITSAYSEVLIPILSDVQYVEIGKIYKCINEFTLEVKNREEESLDIQKNSDWKCTKWDENNQLVTLKNEEWTIKVPLSILKDNFELTN